MSFQTPRWLIDTDQDQAGMQILVDFHGGDPEDLGAMAEFREIKDKVMEEVGTSNRLIFCFSWPDREANHAHTR